MDPHAAVLLGEAARRLERPIDASQRTTTYDAWAAVLIRGVAPSSGAQAQAGGLCGCCWLPPEGQKQVEKGAKLGRGEFLRFQLEEEDRPFAASKHPPQGTRFAPYRREEVSGIAAAESESTKEPRAKEQQRDKLTGKAGNPQAHDSGPAHSCEAPSESA